MKESRMAQDILDRFLRYVAVDTMSDASKTQEKHPTTDGQWELLHMLDRELGEMGIADTEMSDHGILIARIPGNCGKECPTVALMAHVDTSSAVMGNGVKARVIEKYPGGDVCLNSTCLLTEADNPELREYIGGTIVVTDGTTLLGGDDKAGLAQIMAAARHMVEDPSFSHGPVELYFTPDEEIDCGMNYFPYSRSACTWCYTVDGEKRYLIDTECFTAAAVHVTVEGISYHLGSARGRLVNSVTIAAALISALPQAESPEATDERYGYYCPLNVQGNLEKTALDIYIRDFDRAQVDRRIAMVRQLGTTMETLYPGAKITVEPQYQYFNFVEEGKKDPRALDLVHAAGKVLGMPLEEKLIRGGTDGSWMAEARHIPCINLFTGGYNRHSIFEWTALSAMEDGTRLILKMLELATGY